MEEKIAQLEKITQRLMRRSHKTCSAMITPYPISNAVIGDKIEGVILRYMFPCDGVIIKGFIRLGQKPKNAAFVDLKIFNDDMTANRGFTLVKKLLPVDIQLTVKAGDCLSITLSPVDGEIVTEIWLSFLWKPLVNDIEVKSFLIDEIENDLLKTKELLLNEP